MSPALLKVVEQEQQPTGPDHAVGLSQGGGAVVHVADGQGADQGVERVVAERESVSVGDGQANVPIQLVSTARGDLDTFAVEVRCDQVNVVRVPPEVEPRAGAQLQGSPSSLAAYPFPAVPDRQPLDAVPGSVSRATV